MSARDQSHDAAAEYDRSIALAQAMPAVTERRRAIAGAWYRKLLELTVSFRVIEQEMNDDRIVNGRFS